MDVGFEEPLERERLCSLSRKGKRMKRLAQSFAHNEDFRRRGGAKNFVFASVSLSPSPFSLHLFFSFEKENNAGRIQLSVRPLRLERQRRRRREQWRRGVGESFSFFFGRSHVASGLRQSSKKEKRLLSAPPFPLFSPASFAF